MYPFQSRKKSLDLEEYFQFHLKFVYIFVLEHTLNFISF